MLERAQCSTLSEWIQPAKRNMHDSYNVLRVSDRFSRSKLNSPWIHLKPLFKTSPLTDWTKAGHSSWYTTATPCILVEWPWAGPVLN